MHGAELDLLAHMGVSAETKAQLRDRLGTGRWKQFLARRTAYREREEMSPWKADALARRDFALGAPYDGHPYNPKVGPPPSAAAVGRRRMPSPETDPTPSGAGGDSPPAPVPLGDRTREETWALLRELPETADPSEICHWVYDHLGVPHQLLDPRTAPSRGAFAHLQLVQDEPGLKKAFLADYQKRFMSGQGAGEEKKLLSDDGRSLEQLSLDLAELEAEALVSA